MSIRLRRWLDPGEKVLFLNGHRTDVRPGNLALVTAAELRARTLGEPAAPVSLCCQRCGELFEAPAFGGHRKYCSAECASRASRRFEVTPEELENLDWEMPTTEVAKLFCVSDKALEKRCKKYGIRKPPRGYWAKVNADNATDLWVLSISTRRYASKQAPSVQRQSISYIATDKDFAVTAPCQQLRYVTEMVEPTGPRPLICSWTLKTTS